MTIIPRSAILKPVNLLAFFAAVVCTYLLFPPYFDEHLYPLQPSTELMASLDRSWMSALSYVNLKEINWGEEFAFTYGPLSYLSTRIGWGESRWSFLFFDLFVAVNFCCMFFFSLKKSGIKILTGCFMLALALLLPPLFGPSMAFVLLAFLLFWIRYSLDAPVPLTYIFQAIILTLLFFIKANTGLIAFAPFAAGIAYQLYVKKDKWYLQAIYFLLPFIVIIVAARPLNVSLLAYVRSSIALIDGYNQIMYMGGAFGIGQLFGLMILLLSIGLLCHKILRDQTYRIKQLTVLLLYVVASGVLFKQGFVRADIAHMLEFFHFIPLLIFCIYDFHFSKRKMAIAVVVLSVGIAGYFAVTTSTLRYEVKHKIDKSSYINSFKSFTETSGYHLTHSLSPFPDHIKKQIGNHTVDAYPWNTQVLIENGLNFSPRPVFQSYTAYTPMLENMNFAHYQSGKAPDYVVYDYGSIDNRYALFDEPKLNLILERNYTCVDSFTVNNRKTLLLRKNQNRPIKLVKIKEYEMKTDAQLLPQKDVYYEVTISQTLLGNAILILHHTPAIELVVNTKDGKLHQYKTSPKLLASGLFSTAHVTSTTAFRQMALNRTADTSAVVSYRFQPKIKSCYRDKLVVTEYKIEQ